MKVIDSSNARVEIHDDYVLKILKDKSREKLLRFAKECEILGQLQGEYANIVKVYAIDVENKRPSYRMKRYDGNSIELLDRTNGNVQLIASLVLPIVQTLHALSIRNTPVFHRDIKPENLLVETTEGSTSLILADFGCAFLSDPAADRITKDFRAVGARAFLAPEYHHGRVEDVDEKGDIFSIGKVLWYYANGITGDVFPYTLWFPSEYNLLTRQPNTLGIAKLNAIIASCTHHDPEKRMSYSTLEESLVAIMINPEIASEENRRQELETFEQNQGLEKEELRSMVEILLAQFREDVKTALEFVQIEFGTSQLIQELVASHKVATRDDIAVREIVENDSSRALWTFHGRNLSISSAIAPAHFLSRNERNFPKIRLPYIDMRIQSKQALEIRFDKTLRWFFEEDGSFRRWVSDGEMVDTRQLLAKEISAAIDQMIRPS